jgi:hypothetical protein
VVAIAALFVTAGAAAAATGKIEGKVIDSVTKAGINEVEVCAYPGEVCDTTGADGKYAIEGLLDGDYFVEFWAADHGYVRQFFDGVAAFEDADEVEVVGGGTVLGVNAELKKGGAVAGRVTDAATGAGVPEAVVCAFTPSVGECELTDSSGNYTVRGLASGSYTVEFSAESLGYETRFYNEAASFGGATLVGVFAQSTTTEINARLSKPASHVVLPSLPPVAAPAVPPAPVVKRKPKHCKKAFKRVKRHGHTVCVRKHRKKHRS